MIDGRDQLVVGSLQELKELPTFQQGFEALVKRAKERASEIWPGYSYGGMFPGEKQFGMTSALPKFFGSTTTALSTFRQNFTSTGWQDIFNLTVNEDVIIGMMGVSVTDSTINVTGLRPEISDTKFPIVNIEPIKNTEQPAILFKQGLLGEEENSFKLRGYLEATGYQRIVPVGGFVLFKRKDLVITE